MITLEFRKKIIQRAKAANDLEALLLWVNDECELQELTHEQLCYAVDVAKHNYKNKKQ